jgi:DNA adenine methylase
MKPIVKWAGGKRRLLTKIKENLPTHLNGTYFEPFFGGGALFFNLEPKKAFLNDINTELIDFYNIFFDRSKIEDLISILEVHEKFHSKEYFYSIRAQDRNPNYLSMSQVQKAARLIYLNKACFNGLYRVNSKGQFNVPYNNAGKVNLIDRDNLFLIHSFLTSNKIAITSQDYKEVLESAKKGDFVYFDPPYDHLDDKKTFTSYSKFGFDSKDQLELSLLFKKLSERGVNCLLSNNQSSFVKNLYSGFNMIEVNVARVINSNINDRKSISELLIKNY